MHYIISSQISYCQPVSTHRDDNNIWADNNLDTTCYRDDEDM